MLSCDFGLISFFVFDFDGTAIGGRTPVDQFPPDFSSFLDSLAHRGIAWATNTAWDPKDQYALILRSGVRSIPAFLSGHTGRILATVKNGILCADKKHSEMVLKRDTTFFKTEQHRIRKIIAALTRHIALHEIQYNAWSYNGLYLRYSRRDDAKVKKILAPLISDSSYYYYNPSSCGTVLLLPHYMNKGGIIKLMQKKLGVTSDTTCVAGDSFNDMPMFQPGIAAYMVCPANARREIKVLVRASHGVVSKKKFSYGVIDGLTRLLATQCALPELSLGSTTRVKSGLLR